MLCPMPIIGCGISDRFNIDKMKEIPGMIKPARFAGQLDAKISGFRTYGHLRGLLR